jgi:hypothetical protein
MAGSSRGPGVMAGNAALGAWQGWYRGYGLLFFRAVILGHCTGALRYEGRWRGNTDWGGREVAGDWCCRAGAVRGKWGSGDGLGWPAVTSGMAKQGWVRQGKSGMRLCCRYGGCRFVGSWFCGNRTCDG